MGKRILVLVLGSILVAGSGLAATPIATDPFQAPAVSAVRGGQATLLFNPDLASDLGLEYLGTGLRRSDSAISLSLDIREDSALEFDADLGMLQKLISGSLQFDGQFKLQARGRTLDLSNFSIRPRAGTERDLELVDSKQKVWMVIDHVHYETAADGRQLSLRNVDLRVAPALAAWLGGDEFDNLALGSMQILTNIFESPERQVAPLSCADPNWPGEAIPGSPGQTYQADVLLENMSSLDFKRCRQTAAGGTCDGPNTASDGYAIFAPNASLRNSNQSFHADVPWRRKFSGNLPPYGNDQHPYLIWNIYRISAEGQIEQIGRSGVKHAFLTVNTGCAVNCGDNQILGLNCGDVYSSGNNDASSDLGRRIEIIPSTGQWGRCGSSYDADCNGANDNPSWTAYDNRLIVRESQIQASTNPGAQYFYEGWYIIRDDINIFNTMGYRRFTPTFSTVWSAPSATSFTGGPALNAWVNHASPGTNARSVDLEARGGGKMRLAMKATELGNGNWRYDYAVMNFDFTETTTSGAEPNLRILSSRGLNTFEVRTGKAITEGESFRDGDSETANEWVMNKETGLVRWTAPAAGNDLHWGTMFSFSMVGGPPVDGEVTVNSPGNVQITAVVLVPSGSPTGETPLFANGFEQ